MTFEGRTWPPSKPFRQLAAAGLALLAVAAVAFLTVVPLVDGYFELQTQIEDQRRLLGKLRQLAANKEEAQRLARASAESAGGGAFLEGATDALRAANLQALLNGVAERQGVRLRSSRTTPPTERDGLRFISVQAELEANPAALQAMIVEVESMRPYLFIASLQVAPVDTRGRQGDALKVRIGVAGAVAAPGGKG